MSRGTLARMVNVKLRVIFHCSNDFLHFLRWKSELNLPRENWRTDAVVVLRPVVVYRKKSKQQRDCVRSAKQYIHHLFSFESMEALWIPRPSVHETINFLPFQVEWLWTLLIFHFAYWYLIICQGWLFFFFSFFYCTVLMSAKWAHLYGMLALYQSFRRPKRWTLWFIISWVETYVYGMVFTCLSQHRTRTKNDHK